ncbi:MAG: hypothetical protein ACREON_05505 [Gemmatimonadaceae bacterium]
MNTTKAAACLVTVLIAVLGCSQPRTEQARNDSLQAEGQAPTEEQATFVNRVWRVAESNGVAPGQLYVFLSEGTLIVASPNGKPSFGTWSGEGRALTMVEEGVPYKVDVLGLTKTELRIRSHNPGQPVDIRLVSAEGPSPRDSL